MKQFNLEEYLANPNRKVVSREGRPVRILCTDLDDADYPVAAAIGNINPTTFTPNGQFQFGVETKYDLFFAPEKHEGWVNIYRHIKYGDSFCGSVYASVEEAKEHATSVVVATTKIEWEE